MRMLRLALVLTLALVWAPEVSAQVFPGVIAPGGTLAYSDASVTCVNTANECQVFQYTVPAAYLATASAINALVSPYLDGTTPTGFHTPVLWNTPQPMHLSMAGLLAGSSGASYQIGVNLGGTAATIGFANTMTAAQGLIPIYLDVWLVPIASSTATPTSGNNNMFLTARLSVAAAVNTPASQTQVHALAAMNLASPNQLNVLNRWQAGSNASTIIWLKRLLKVGD